jgi:hypothetical protein
LFNDSIGDVQSSFSFHIAILSFDEPVATIDINLKKNKDKLKFTEKVTNITSAYINSYSFEL